MACALSWRVVRRIATSPSAAQNAFKVLPQKWLRGCPSHASGLPQPRNQQRSGAGQPRVRKILHECLLLQNILEFFSATWGL